MLSSNLLVARKYNVTLKSEARRCSLLSVHLRIFLIFFYCTSLRIASLQIAGSVQTGVFQIELRRKVTFAGLKKFSSITDLLTALSLSPLLPLSVLKRSYWVDFPQPAMVLQQFSDRLSADFRALKEVAYTGPSLLQGSTISPWPIARSYVLTLTCCIARNGMNGRRV